jgi:hypothetical protein
VGRIVDPVEDPIMHHLHDRICLKTNRTQNFADLRRFKSVETHGNQGPVLTTEGSG